MRRYAFHQPLTELKSEGGLFLARAVCKRCEAKASGSGPQCEQALYQALQRLDETPACVPVVLDESDFPAPTA